MFTVEMDFTQYARYINSIRYDYPAYQIPIEVGQDLVDYARENFDEMDEEVQELIRTCQSDVDLMEEIVRYYAI